ncbi:microtubule nucleation factor SSNA1-like [Leptopilina boulardi]|uniref:microtubule nucleation factor SSNA1-like n=1 Tax=Leptopilina boulardi TaxID=63433 RepID=UPI0021F5B29D|nr:microtubule nucleation factor SSNA1-like [Leptopilina boulardi]
MQDHQDQLTKCINELKGVRKNLDDQIHAEEEKRNQLMQEVERMSYKINELNESLAKKAASRHEYDRTIQEAEGAYEKIIESSQLLLNLVKREAASLDETLHTK